MRLLNCTAKKSKAGKYKRNDEKLLELTWYIPLKAQTQAATQMSPALKWHPPVPPRWTLREALAVRLPDMQLWSPPGKG